MGNRMNPITILSALAEPTRLEALRMVWDGREHCVCELMRELGASQSRMSRHMAALKTAGLLADRRDAQWVRYRRAPNLPQEVVALVDAASGDAGKSGKACRMSVGAITEHAPSSGPSTVKWIGWTVAALIIWGVVYSQLVPFSDWVVASTRVDPNSHLGEAISFFAYDTPKVLMLLTLVVFGMGVVRSFFSPEKTRALLAGKREGVGNVLAASLGIVTPFCSCSAVPLFIGFVSAGVPLGVTFSFLISAPMVNEVALGTSVRAGGLESGADLSRLWPCRCHCLWLDHRPAPSRTLAGGVGS